MTIKILCNLHPQSVSNKTMLEIQKANLAQKCPPQSKCSVHTFHTYLTAEPSTKFTQACKLGVILYLSFALHYIIPQIILALPLKYILNASACLHLSTLSRKQDHIISCLNSCYSFMISALSCLFSYAP